VGDLEILQEGLKRGTSPRRAASMAKQLLRALGRKQLEIAILRIVLGA